MTALLQVLLLDISDSKVLSDSVDKFFADRPVSVVQVTDVNLFKILSRNRRKFAMAVGLVNAGNAHLVKGKNQVPTFIFQSHTFTHKKLSQFYSDNGGGDG